MNARLLRWLISPFPPDSVFRRVGKRLVRGLAARQDFYGGVIYFDAVGQSWALKGTPYEQVDVPLKEELLKMSRTRDCYLDIGCNIGQLVLALLLRNRDIAAVCVDPNPKVLRLFEKSLAANRLTPRVTIKQAAVGNEKGFVHFTSEVSEMGHVADEGTRVECLCLADLVNEYSARRCLIKLDVEGFETVLFQRLDQFQNRHNLCLVVELHARGYNQGHPSECVRLLRQSGAVLRHLDGQLVTEVDDTQITQVVAEWLN